MDLKRRKRISDLAELLWEKPESDWRIILGSACGEDDELYDEVVELARQSLSPPAKLVVGIRANDLRQDPAEVGNYAILGRIGAGGMGVVYKARLKSEELRTEPVALKMLLPGLDNLESRKRFKAEWQVVGKLVHPNISRILEANYTDDGQPFYVMEYVAGSDGSPAPPLDVYFAQTPIDLPARLRIVHALCEALAFAHKRNVIHRDIKPGNILVTPNGEPHLLDFGLARLIHARESDASMFRSEVASPLRTGTLKYMSPEQVKGEPLDERTDIYSLGVILYELVTGRPPYEFTSSGEARRIICETVPPPPSSMLSPDVNLTARQRRDLDRLVLKALSKTQSGRYSTAGEWAEEIDRFLRRYVGIRPANAVSMKTWARHYVVGVIPSAVLVLAVSSAIWWQRASSRKVFESPRTQSSRPGDLVVGPDSRVGKDTPHEARDNPSVAGTNSPAERSSETHRTPGLEQAENDPLAAKVVVPPPPGRASSDTGAMQDEVHGRARTPMLPGATLRNPADGEPRLARDLVKVQSELEQDINRTLLVAAPAMKAERRTVVATETRQIVMFVHSLMSSGDIPAEYFSEFPGCWQAQHFYRRVSSGLSLLRQLARTGNLFAAALLGELATNNMLQGAQEAIDPDEGIEWAQRAAASGNAAGKLYIGEIYQNRYQRGFHSGESEANEAVRLITFAADNDIQKAQITLGERHTLRPKMILDEPVPGLQGLSTDLVRGYMLLTLAATNPRGSWFLGMRDPKERRIAALTLQKRAAKQMTPAQVAEAEARAQAWVKAHRKPYMPIHVECHPIMPGVAELVGTILESVPELRQQQVKN